MKWNWATIHRIKVLVLDHVLSRDAEWRIVDQSLLQQVHSSWVDIFDFRIEIVLVPAREGCFVIRQRSHSRPNVFSWRSENAEHAEELIDFWISLEQWFARCHFGKDATNWPNINWTWVTLRTKQDFGCSVPQCDDLVSIIANRNAEWASQAEISNLDNAFLVDEQVLRLQIAMQDTTAMTEEHCGGDLIQIAANKLRIHHFLRGQWVHVLLQIHWQELEDEIKTIILHQHIFQCNNVWMLQFLQQRDFTKIKVNEILKFICMLVVVQTGLLCLEFLRPRLKIISKNIFLLLRKVCWNLKINESLLSSRIFFIATIWPLFLFRPLYTTPYVPSPIFSIFWKSSITRSYILPVLARFAGVNCKILF